MVQRTSGRTGVFQKKIRKMRGNWGMSWLELVWFGLQPLKLWAVREQLVLEVMG